ncbi:PREDICTED: agamous-like MADS-box protein AGL103 [Camelina sativa]|uniref:Agamous-like MADS-box protein AGL103 n=1 Tax=Camelina sativa TaxID=90675 RepID=A0ABM0ZC69_CAMSA|nr:PREDICTED: agamous-like MADS-box protein AGL103 [Camelina sativa]
MKTTTKPNSAYSSSSSHESQRATSLMKRQMTVFKKARELFVLCAIEVCMICYGADGELKTYPGEKEKKLVRPRRVSKFPVWDPRIYNYSGEQVTGLVQSLERNLTRLQDRFHALVEVEEQRKIQQYFNPQGGPSSSTTTFDQYLPQQQQPNQFSMFLFNHENGNVWQIPLDLMNKGKSLLVLIPPELLMIHLNPDVGNYSRSLGAFGPPLYDLSQPLFS